jgi:Predicted permeases
VIKKLDWFIIKSFLGPLVLTFLIATFILTVQFLWLYIDELVGKGLGFGVILEFLMWGTVTLIPLSLPLATLLASIMTLGSLGENNELLAMKTAGISLQRIISPLIIIAVLICITAFFSANNLIPLAYKKIYALRDDISNTDQEIRLPVGIFYNGIENYTLRIEDRDKRSDMLYGVMLYDHSNRKGNTNITLADSGAIRLTTDKRNILFTLYNGYRYEEGDPKGSKDSSLVMQKTYFDRQDAIISLREYGFQRNDDNRFGDEIMAQNLARLSHRKDSLDSTLVAHHTRSYYRFLNAPHFSHYTQFDSLERQKRQTLFPLDSLPDISKDIETQINYWDNVHRNLDAAVSSLSTAEFESRMVSTGLRKTSLEWYRKFTISLACLIFFFIGAPLGAIIRKGGLGAPVIVSGLLFVVYWVVDISGRKLATDGVINPAMGALISSLVLLPLGVFLTWKATTDSNLFNADAYLSAIKKFFASFQRLNPFKKPTASHV